MKNLLIALSLISSFSMSTSAAESMTYKSTGALGQLYRNCAKLRAIEESYDKDLTVRDIDRITKKAVKENHAPSVIWLITKTSRYRFEAAGYYIRNPSASRFDHMEWVYNDGGMGRVFAGFNQDCKSFNR